MAASEGPDFKGEQITCLRDFAGKITGGGMNLSDGGCTVAPGFRKATAHATLMIECLFGARRTKATAAAANLNNEPGKQVMHALAVRNFAGKWKSSRLAEPTGSTPAEVEANRLLVSAGFGAFENGETACGAMLNPGTRAGDWVLYVSAGTVVLKMRVLDVPTLDLGFSEQLLWWQQELPGIQQSNAPFCLVAVELGRLLTTADLQRRQSMSFSDNSDAESLTFKTTPEIESGKQRLLNHAQGAQQHEMVAMQRYFDEHGRKVHGPETIQDLTSAAPNRDVASHSKRVSFRDNAPRQQKKSTSPGPAAPQQRTLTVIKKPATPGTIGTINVNRDLRRDKWQRAYGWDKDADNKAPCWHHPNRTGGCTHGDDCKLGHKKRPAPYKGQHWDQLDSKTRQEIIAKVAEM